jgi:hypothetical protein
VRSRSHEAPHRAPLSIFLLLPLGPNIVLGTCFLGAFAKLRKVTITFVMSVRPAVHPHGRKSAPTGRVLIKFDIKAFFEKYVEKIQVLYMKTFSYLWQYVAELFLE